MTLRCHWHRWVMTLWCHWHCCVMTLWCHWHCWVMTFRCHWRSWVMTSRCHWHRCVMTLSCHWHCWVMTLRCHQQFVTRISCWISYFFRNYFRVWIRCPGGDIWWKTGVQKSRETVPLSYDYLTRCESYADFINRRQASSRLPGVQVSGCLFLLGQPLLHVGQLQGELHGDYRPATCCLYNFHHVRPDVLL